MTTFKQLSRTELPREKLFTYGVDTLKDEELLAILLRTGGKNIHVLDLSKKVLSVFKKNITEISVHDLLRIKSLGKAKACEIVACFELGKRFLKNKKSALILNPESVWRECKDIRDSKREHFVIFFLDVRNQELKREVISVGTLTSSVVHPREVFEPAVMCHAAHIICAHNHPSGSTDPSPEDIAITKRLEEAGKILGIDVLDHVIVTKDRWKSIKNGILVS